MGCSYANILMVSKSEIKEKKTLFPLAHGLHQST